jgi:hypothetical protein
MQSKRIASLQKYRDRPPNGNFDALPPEARPRARALLYRFCHRWGNDLPPWRYAILVGRAKQLALNPPDSAWGHKMLAKRGGKAVQKLYRFEGRDPTAAPNAARRQKAERKLRQEAEAAAQRHIDAFSNVGRWIL